MLLNCNRGCKFSDGTTDGSLDLETNEVICNKCGDIISGISDFAKISMKNIKDIKRINKKKAFVFPCKTCDKNVETEVLTGRVKGKDCNSGNCQINITDFMVKMIEENNKTDFEGNNKNGQ